MQPDDIYRYCKAGCGTPVTTPRGRYCDDCRAARDAESKRRHKARARTVVKLPLDDVRPCCEMWLESRSAMFEKYGRAAALKRWPELVHKQCAQCRQWKAANAPAPLRLLLPAEDFTAPGFSVEKRHSVGSVAYCNAVMGDAGNLCGRLQGHEGYPATCRAADRRAAA
jgi:hypothetical protein